MDRTNAIDRDIFDAEVFNDARRGHTRLAQSYDEGGATLTTAPDLLHDVFQSLHQPTPTLATPDELAPTHRPNHGIVGELVQTREWGDVRAAGTVGDEMAAAFAATVITEKAVAALSDADRARINDLARLTEQAARLYDDADTLQEWGDANNRPDLIEQADRKRDEARQARTDAAATTADLDATAEDRADTVRRAIRQAAASAADQLAELGTAIDVYGMPGTNPGDRRGALTTQDKLGIAQRLRRNPRLATLAAMVGRYANVALNVQRSKIDRVPSEIASVTRGNDLAHVLPSELALLADAATEDVFYHRFGERALQQYRLNANEKVGRGPLIVATDESASMRGSFGDHDRDLWAKAVALALLAVARHQRRDFAWVHFGSAGELRVEHFKDGRATAAETIAAADHFFNGGTDYEGWMGKALALVETSAYDKADVILLSDGEAHVGGATAARWNAARKARGMRAYGVLIGVAPTPPPTAPDPNSASLADMVKAHYTATPGGVVGSICDYVAALDSSDDEGDFLRAIFAV